MLDECPLCGGSVSGDSCPDCEPQAGLFLSTPRCAWDSAGELKARCSGCGIYASTSEAKVRETVLNKYFFFLPQGAVAQLGLTDIGEELKKISLDAEKVNSLGLEKL